VLESQLIHTRARALKYSRGGNTGSEGSKITDH
jgi:hypothetical protein